MADMLTPAQVKELHKVQAISGFEVAECLDRWAQLANAQDARVRDDGDLGPPWMKTREHEAELVYAESTTQWAQRMALGVLTLLREI